MGTSPEQHHHGPDRTAFHAALGNEYFALQGSRSSTILEAMGRATLFFTTVADAAHARSPCASEKASATASARPMVPRLTRAHLAGSRCAAGREVIMLAAQGDPIAGEAACQLRA